MSPANWCLVILAIGAMCWVVHWWASRPVVEAQPAEGTETDEKKTLEEPSVESEPAANEAAAAHELPKLSGGDEDEDVEPTRVGAAAKSTSAPAIKIVYDDDAADDEPTQQRPLILVSAAAQSDKGTRRKRNEDSVLMLEEHGLFIVADGMGGYAGGQLASSLAVKTIEAAFERETFAGPVHENIPPRASELARAIQMANEAVLTRAAKEKQLEGMGTTICAARFSSNKQRLYVGHVGDSRIYCLRDGRLSQMTSDHTMRDYGVGGAAGAHLSRAVGIWPVVPVDIVLGKPRPGDSYLICSDGLTKMVDDAEIERILQQSAPQLAVERLVDVANDHGGKDNITVVVVHVTSPEAKVA